MECQLEGSAAGGGRNGDHGNDVGLALRWRCPSRLAGLVMWIEEFVSLLKKSSVTQPRLDEALALKQQHLPRFLYKYFRVTSHSLDNLRNDTVWICSPKRTTIPTIAFSGSPKPT